ncbi:MAG: LamG domain-containing protein [Myxococcales bacterium]
MNRLWAMVTVLLASCTAGPLDVVDNSLWRGLVAHWSLDETAGTTVTDDSGNDHHGTLTGGTWIEGQFKSALHFEVGTEVSVPAFPSAKERWTVALWVRPPSEDLGSTYLTLVSTELVFKGGWEMNVRLAPNDRYYQFSYYLGPDKSDYYTHNCSCVAQRWTHLAAVVDGTAGTLAFYRDGALDTAVSMPPAASPSGPRLILPGSDTLFMGRFPAPDPGEMPPELRLFKGDLDDVAIYDRALLTYEVAALAQGPVPPRH